MTPAWKLVSGLLVLGIYDPTGEISIGYEVVYAGPDGPNAVSPAHQEWLRAWGWEYYDDAQCWGFPE